MVKGTGMAPRLQDARSHMGQVLDAQGQVPRTPTPQWCHLWEHTARRESQKHSYGGGVGEGEAHLEGPPPPPTPPRSQRSPIVAPPTSASSEMSAENAKSVSRAHSTAASRSSAVLSSTDAGPRLWCSRPPACMKPRPTKTCRSSCTHAHGCQAPRQAHSTSQQTACPRNNTAAESRLLKSHRRAAWDTA